MSLQARHPGTTITPGGGGGAGPIPVSGVVFPITQADLVAGVFPAVHNLGNQYVTYKLYDDTDLDTQPDDATALNVNELDVDLTNFQPIPGIWHLIVVG